MAGDNSIIAEGFFAVLHDTGSVLQQLQFHLENTLLIPSKVTQVEPISTTGGLL